MDKKASKSILEVGLSGIDYSFPEIQGSVLSYSKRVLGLSTSPSKHFEWSRGDVGGAEPPTLTVTANDMADELEALPKALKDEMGAEEIIGELRRQGDEVAVAIENSHQQRSINQIKYK